MENLKEFITISEFSEMVGISKQAVYSRLETGLKDYVKKINGKKMINKKALELYNIQPIEQDFQEKHSTLEQNFQENLKENSQEFKEVEQGIQEKHSTLEQNFQPFNSTLEILNNTITVLKEQLQEKDKQIEKKDLQIAELHNLLSQSQQLQAGTVHRLTEPKEAQPEEEPIENKKRWSFLKKNRKK